MNSSEAERQCCGRGTATVLAVLGACLIFAALIWVTKKYTQPAPLNANRATERADALKKLTEENAVALDEAGWIDPAKGIVRLPIAIQPARGATQRRIAACVGATPVWPPLALRITQPRLGSGKAVPPCQAEPVQCGSGVNVERWLDSSYAP